MLPHLSHFICPPNNVFCDINSTFRQVEGKYRPKEGPKRSKSHENKGFESSKAYTNRLRIDLKIGYMPIKVFFFRTIKFATIEV